MVAVTFLHTVPAVLGSQFLDVPDVASLGHAHGAIGALVLARTQTGSIDAKVLHHPRFNRGEGPTPQKDQALSEAILAVAICFNYSPAKLLYWLGGEFYAQHRSTGHIREILRPCCTPDHINEVIYMLTRHTPRRLLSERIEENLRLYMEYGNHSSIDREDAVMVANKVIDKDDRAQYVVTLPRWIWHFLQHMHLTLLGLLEKKRKFYLLFDARFQPGPTVFVLNDVTLASDELPVA